MRTQIPRILPGCIWCNFDHDPAIECRFKDPNDPQPERNSHMEHIHEPIKDKIEMNKQGLSAIRTDHCTCGAIRTTKITGNVRQPGEWTFPDDPPPVGGSQACSNPQCGLALGHSGDCLPPGWCAQKAKIGRQHTESSSQVKTADLETFVAKGQSAQAAVDLWHTITPDPPRGLENGLQKPSKLQYVAKHANVLHGSENVARAKSTTLAKRIARALNQLREPCPKCGFTESAE